MYIVILSLWWLSLSLIVIYVNFIVWRFYSVITDQIMLEYDMVVISLIYLSALSKILTILMTVKAKVIQDHRPRHGSSSQGLGRKKLVFLHTGKKHHQGPKQSQSGRSFFFPFNGYFFSAFFDIYWRKASCHCSFTWQSLSWNLCSCWRLAREIFHIPMSFLLACVQACF